MKPRGGSTSMLTDESTCIPRLGGVSCEAAPRISLKESIKDICITIAQRLGIPPVYAQRDSEPLHLFSSIRKMADHNCRPQIRIADRIQEVVDP